jgi:hypothetical protein
MHYDEQPDTTEHFRLVLGYDAARDEVVYHEPAEPHASYRRMKRARFLALWPLKYSPDLWTVIRLRLEDGGIRAPERARARGPAEYAQHVMALRDRLSQDFRIVVEPPFVVIGNGSRAEVAAWAQGTVRRAVAALRKAYFAKDPERILDVFLFDDARSYERHAQRLSGHPPQTPYGYYDPDAGALIMNIATGGGTLVHELVHPFMHANFPECPAWFNEGMGSLYEQSRFREGALIGMTNWRLPGLQQAIRQERTASLHALTGASDREFYGDDTGVNYAHARYLLYYLQEHGLLQRYYREFRGAQREDPTGYAALLRVLDRTPQQMPEFERELNRYILALRFP